MSWPGYFEFDGTEILNVERVESYASRLPWFHPTFRTESLAPMLGERYTTPLIDDPPWSDPDVPESYDFCGVYPLDVDGLESSTRTATITESTGDGGVAGLIRHATKQVVFSAILVATSEAGAEYGQKWLRRVLLGNPCDAAGCFGATLCYLSSEPEMETEGPWPDGSVAAILSGGTAMVHNDRLVLSGGDATSRGGQVFSGGDAKTRTPVLTRSASIFHVPNRKFTDISDCITPYRRTLRKVTFPTGPTVTAKHRFYDGGAVWRVTFTAVAGSPFEFSSELEVVNGFGDPDVEVPWSGGVEPAGAAFDLDGYMTADAPCSAPVLQPLYDPLHPAVNLPPGVPSIPLGFFDPPVHWRRRQFTIPKQYVPLWGEMVPVVSLHARDSDVRNLRLRFYADPFGLGQVGDDPCGFCGDIVFSYIPQGYSMTFDGAEETVSVTGPGGITQRADSLVFASDGTPFDWPRLTCGSGYVVTLDSAATAKPPVVDLSLIERTV